MCDILRFTASVRVSIITFEWTIRLWFNGRKPIQTIHVIVRIMVFQHHRNKFFVSNFFPGHSGDDNTAGDCTAHTTPHASIVSAKMWDKEVYLSALTTTACAVCDCLAYKNVYFCFLMADNFQSKNSFVDLNRLSSWQIVKLCTVKTTASQVQRQRCCVWKMAMFYFSSQVTM